MTKTSTELAWSVLRRMAVCSSTDSPAAADVAYVKEVYGAKLQEWTDRDLVYWTDDTIPEPVFQTLVLLLVNEVQSAFGMSEPIVQQRATEENLLWGLRRHVRKQTSRAPVIVSDF